MVNRDRFIVYAVDHVKKTAAHYAAKKGYLEMLHMLKDRCADFHCVDDNHKSAFYYAVRNNNSSCVMFLIGEKSNPFQITTIEIKAMRIGRKVQNLVMEAKKVHIIMMFKNSKDLKETAFYRGVKKIMRLVYWKISSREDIAELQVDD